MNVKTFPIMNALVLPFLLAGLVVVVTFTTISGGHLPLINGPRAALVALLVIGMTMCAIGGIGQVGASGRWASPLAILGYLLGIALFAVIIGGLSGWQLPMIKNQNDAVVASAALIGVKLVLGILGYVFRLL